MLDAAYANLSELARLAAEYAEETEEDPERLAEVERRRDLLFRLSQKYGATVEAVLATRTEAAAELDLLDTADMDLRAIGARRVAAEGALRSAAEHSRRAGGTPSDRLARGVNRLLPQLGLPGGKLRVGLHSAVGAGLARSARAFSSTCSSTWGSRPSRSRRWRPVASCRG